jgi:ATP-dependent DNA ligase
MNLPIKFSYRPMEAKSARELPNDNHWQYEPKWDGFRCLAFREREKIELQSKAGRSLTRYFPDIVQALKTLEAQRFVLAAMKVFDSRSGRAG